MTVRFPMFLAAAVIASTASTAFASDATDPVAVYAAPAAPTKPTVRASSVGRVPVYAAPAAPTKPTAATMIRGATRERNALLAAPAAAAKGAATLPSGDSSGVASCPRSCDCNAHG